ncbi:phospholipase A2 [Actinokineospora globicatena]|uniref:phospholipase A2 n=1 Tax=Actinokineospora globicatena TaxID=103729 RepID=UPI0020A40406|nr:phospholipase A2 [Actinokineospora globicatena]MCP2303840.1 phospholipase A2 [Actinokineospora globicatena]GLW79005.1 hypothetical protein Aglo01_34870 [Actinokineospora globicatena]GLW86584.1 hypothetical protein Aglo02_42230 [Actinokineospora globicatena]
MLPHEKVTLLDTPSRSGPPAPCLPRTWIGVLVLVLLGALVFALPADERVAHAADQFRAELPLLDDTDVNSSFDGADPGGPYLKAGTETDGERARTYLRFDTRGLRAPLKAELRITNVDAPGCGPAVGAGIQVRRVTGFWTAASQTWTPQPDGTTEDAASSTEGSQQGTCGSGVMTWDVTAIVARWATGTPNHGLVLRSPTETATANHRVFTSSEHEDGTRPTLTITTDTPVVPGEGDDPADPGPSPSDAWPGHAEPDTGVWITGGTDTTEAGLITTRSHAAGQRIDQTRRNEAVLGPRWRLEPLGGSLGDRLKDFSANGYLQLARSTGTASTRFVADPASPGTFKAEDGSMVVRGPSGTFREKTATDPPTERVWALVNGELLVTATGTAQVGMSAVGYDAQGRYAVLTAPCGCESLTFGYATTTTATASRFGDVAGQLARITHDPAGDAPPVVVSEYAYDQAKRLREVRDLRQVDGNGILTSTYGYDSTGNLTTLSTPVDGTWALTYAAAGKLASAARPPAVSALPSQCKYASQYLWGTDGCWVGPVPMAYGGKKLQPSWKRTPGRKAVVGVNDDHCTTSPDQPRGFDFRAACDMHDYGYGIIYLKTRQWDRSRKGAVDAVFFTTLRDYTCNAYPVLARNPSAPYGMWTPRATCREFALSYYAAVSATGGLSMKYWYQY